MFEANRSAEPADVAAAESQACNHIYGASFVNKPGAQTPALSPTVRRVSHDGQPSISHPTGLSCELLLAELGEFVPDPAPEFLNRGRITRAVPAASPRGKCFTFEPVQNLRGVGMAARARLRLNQI